MNTQDETPEMEDSTAVEKGGQKQGQRIHWLFAIPLTVWCALWLAFNGFNYLFLTWRLFAALKWWSLVLLINPYFYLWIAFFGSSVWAPLNFLWLPWVPWHRDFGRWKAGAMIFFVPMIFGILLEYVGPYFYPITFADHGMFFRCLPFVGGKSYG